MRLHQVLPDAPRAVADVEVDGLAYDNRKVAPGTLFFCVPGFSRDGHDFAADAVQRGAAALVVQRPLPLAVPQVQVENVRRAMASYTLEERELDELDLILRDVDPNYAPLSPNDEHDIILRFFTVIRLELLYMEGRGYYKIKLRRLLKKFKYKRRSQTLVQSINHAMTVLSLVPYLRDHVPCDISAIGIDDMVMIRLKA